MHVKRSINHSRLLFLVVCGFLLTSCETTEDYGYYVGVLDVESIEALFAESDEAIRELDYNTYSSLLAPRFVAVDRTSGVTTYLSRQEYLEAVKELFDSAAYIEVATLITDIQFIDPGRRALITTQDEERRKVYGNTQHFTSISEIEVGIEDGWVFFEKSTRIAQQVIDE